MWNDTDTPLAVFFTFRCYGTWLHGDERSSVRRNGNNRFGGPKVTPSVPLKEAMLDARSQSAFMVDAEQRECVRATIIGVCEFRSYPLRAINVRTNHVHAVVSAAVKPEKIVNDLKVYSTRWLRAERLCGVEQKVWSRGSSTRYLWKPHHVEGAVDYVLYCQEDIPFEFRD